MLAGLLADRAMSARGVAGSSGLVRERKRWIAEEESMAKATKGLTRRSFLTTTALAAGALTVSACSGGTEPTPEPAPTDGKTIDTSGDAAKQVVAQAAEETYAINTCRGNCGMACPQKATVREGKMVKCLPLEVPKEYRKSQSLTGCVKGRTNPQRLYSVDRVLYPLKRTGERGAGEWEQITWDEAISEIAEKFQVAIDTHGGSSVAIWKGYGSPSGVLNGAGISMTNNPYGLAKNGIGFSRFAQKVGATILEPSSDMAAQYMIFVGLSMPQNSFEDAVNAKTYITLGRNWSDTANGDWAMVEARRNGATVVAIDPVYTKTAAHSDIWVPVRPGTDGALLLAMCNYIIDNDLIDYDFLRNKSVAPLLVKEDMTYLKLSDIGRDPVAVEGKDDPVDSEVVYDPATGEFGSSREVIDPEIEGSFEVEGIPVRTVYSIVKEGIKDFTVEYAAAECDIPASQIEQIADLFATNKPATIAPGMGFEHYKNSWHVFKTLVLLGSLTGNIGKPGASIMSYLPASSIANFAKVGAFDSVVEDALPNVGITGEYLIDIAETGKFNGQDYPIDAVYIMCSNPVSNGCGRNKIIEAFEKVGFVVVADSFMTDTARYADIVLPVTMSWEHEDCRGNYFLQKAVEPMGEAKPDIDIFRALADKMGYTDLYDKTDEEYLRVYLDTPENLEAGCGYDDAREQSVFGEAVYAPTVLPMNTATGRAQFYMPTVRLRDLVDMEIRPCDHYPWYEEALEAYEANPLKETYPLYAVSNHHHYWGQCIFPRVPWLDELRGEPYVVVHEDAAKARGIKDDDMVRVFNERGEVVLRAKVSQGIRPDTLMLPHGPETNIYVKGHNQSLTLPALDAVTGNNNYNDFLCEIEVYEGGAE